MANGSDVDVKIMFRDGGQYVIIKNISRECVYIDKNMIYGFEYSYPEFAIQGFMDTVAFPIEYAELTSIARFVPVSPGKTLTKPIERESVQAIRIFDNSILSGLHFAANKYPPDIYLSESKILSEEFMVLDCEYNPSGVHFVVFDMIEKSECVQR